jgi:hypothetical protein
MISEKIPKPMPESLIFLRHYLGMIKPKNKIESTDEGIGFCDCKRGLIPNIRPMESDILLL